MKHVLGSCVCKADNDSENRTAAMLGVRDGAAGLLPRDLYDVISPGYDYRLCCKFSRGILGK